MSIQEQHENLLESTYQELENLKTEVTQLEKIRKEIEELVRSSGELPKIFAEKFEKVVKHAESYTNSIGAATKIYLDGNNTLFTKYINELTNKIQDLEKQITRLVNTDFIKLFKELQNKFLEQSQKDLAVELKKIEEKTKDLHTKIIELKKEVTRLEKIDLEKHFDKLQKTLADIFGAINSMNGSLTNVIQTLTAITQGLGNIQSIVVSNHKEAIEHLADFKSTTEKHLNTQDNIAQNNLETIVNKLNTLSEQNLKLNKQVKINRAILIIGGFIVFSTLLLMYLKYLKVF